MYNFLHRLKISRTVILARKSYVSPANNLNQIYIFFDSKPTDSPFPQK